jgi:hypothetical protein
MDVLFYCVLEYFQVKNRNEILSTYVLKVLLYCVGMLNLGYISWVTCMILDENIIFLKSSSFHEFSFF